MSFRILGALLFSCVFLLSCARRDEPNSKPIVVRRKPGSCFKGFGTQLGAFFNGELSQSEINAFWTCAITCLEDFASLTKGEKRPDAYSAEALRKFIEHYFAGPNSVSPRLMSGIMEVKRLLAGGTLQYVTRAELTELTGLVQELLPHMAIITRSHRAVADEQVRAANQAIHLVLVRITQRLEREKVDYSFEQIDDLLANISSWLQNHNPAARAKSQARLKVASLIKGLLTGNEPDFIRAHDWQTLGIALSRFAGLYLSLVNGLDKNLDATLTSLSLPENLGLVVEVLNASAQKQPDKQISFVELQNVLEAAIQAGLLPESLRIQPIMDMLEWLLRRVLVNDLKTPLQGQSDVNTNGIHLSHLGVLATAIANWNQLLQRTNAQNTLDRQFSDILSSSTPLVWDQEGHLYYPEQKTKEWNQESRVHMIWPFVVLQLVKNAYTSPDLNYLTEEQVDEAVREILPLLQNFGWLKATKLSIGKRILKEADLFTASANGDAQLDLAEGIHYLAFVSSSYHLANTWLKFGTELCPTHDASCLRAQWQTKGHEALAPMPGLASAVSTWKTDYYLNYFRFAEQIALEKVVEGEYGLGDLLMVLQILQYVEMFYLRFDQDSSFSISSSESLNALPIYGPALNRLLAFGTLPEDEVRALFTFMMKYGETPFTLFGGQILFTNWKLKPDSWVFEAERMTLISILNSLSALQN